MTETDKDLWFALKVCLNMATQGRVMNLLLTRTTGRIKQLRKFLYSIERAAKKLTYIDKGIVTKFVLKLYPQTDVWVGLCPNQEMTFQHECRRERRLASKEIWQTRPKKPFPDSFRGDMITRQHS